MPSSPMRSMPACRRPSVRRACPWRCVESPRARGRLNGPNDISNLFDLSPYHLLLVGGGVSIILAYWLPRFVSGREPAASALLIGLGAMVAAIVPGLRDGVNPLLVPQYWEHVSELCLIIGLFGAGLRIDRLASRTRWRPTFGLLAIAMPLTIAAIAMAGWWIGGMTAAGALLLGAALAPTDPVLARDVQVGPPQEGGEHPVRFALTTEAGLNDGLAFPFVHLAMLMAAGPLAAAALFEWAAVDVVYRIAAGLAAGVGAGWLLGRILFDWPRGNALADTESGVIAFAGVLITYGATELIGGYGFIASFVAGLSLRRDGPHQTFRTRLHDFSQALEHALTAVLLLGFGAAIPSLIASLDLVGAGIAAALIFLVRPVSGWISLRGLMRDRARAVVSFYGVRGVGTIYYLAYATNQAMLPDAARAWAICAFAIVLSTLIHGFTAGMAVERATGEATPPARTEKPKVIDAAS